MDELRKKFSAIGPGIPEGAVDATEFVVAAIARDLRAAREHAGLSQEALGKKIRKPASTIAAFEAGEARVTEQQVRSILRGCGLPDDWKGQASGARRLT